MICDESVFENSKCIRLNILRKIYFQSYRRGTKINESNCNDEFLDSNQEKYLILVQVCAYLIFGFVWLKTIKFFFSRLSFADTIHDVFYYFCLYLVYSRQNAEDQSAVGRLRNALLS